jgi:hypothetical protein
MVKQNAEGMIENYDKQEKTVVRLYFVQPKSLQECSIIIYDDAAIHPVLPPTPAGEAEDGSSVSFSPLSWEIWLLAWSLLPDRSLPL